MFSFKNNITTRWILLMFSFVIVSLILWNTYLIFISFREEERVKMEIWAKAYETINNADPEHTDIDFPSQIVIKNTSIPIILTNGKDSILNLANIDVNKYKSYDAQLKLLKELKSANPPIEINHPIENQFIYYGNSTIITKLKFYPLALILILLLFGILVVSYFKTLKSSTESRLWAGMAKETAHQIGTPLTSLLGWTELLRMENTPKEMLDEIEKDVHRLQIIADRFSKIGSKTDLELLNIVDLTRESFSYLQARSSKQIEFRFESTADIVPIWLNSTLHIWTIENLVKNAIDAIKGKGKITIRIKYNDPYVQIFVIDTGKGIEKNKFQTVFEPGYSTKKRGWGLGLSLTKRIVETYHKGKIKVLHSELNKGTTFLITYKKRN
ncbi:PAS domain-containing sensor histidine kinase [Capnocytophaga sp. ARDL2]|uniref:sensor histidine kinase n=1 Tax=Capnocytophaga sp. ARDL2 TaxID=3238809 RepID=UPI00355603C2